MSILSVYEITRYSQCHCLYPAYTAPRITLLHALRIPNRPMPYMLLATNVLYWCFGLGLHSKHAA